LVEGVVTLVDPLVEATERAFLRVGDGRGFVAELGPERFVVITAAHCLPSLPPPMPASYTEERTYTAILGPLGGSLSVWAECAFVDPISDVAVLVAPDGQSLPNQCGAYEMLLEDRPALTLAVMPSNAPVWLLTLDGRWARCEAERCGGFAAFAETVTLKGPEEAYAPGTSGSPILTDEGQVVSLVSVGNSLSPVLTDALPPRVIGRRHATHREEDGGSTHSR
jgi:hypothetical protein